MESGSPHTPFPAACNGNGARCDGAGSVLIHLVFRSRNNRSARPALVARLLSGVIFVFFGLGKFTAHAAEAASFPRYGLPAPSAFVYAVGALEIVGGLLLVAGFVMCPVALAPALLVAMLALVWAEAGERSLDSRVATRLKPGYEVLTRPLATVGRVTPSRARREDPHGRARGDAGSASGARPKATAASCSAHRGARSCA